tara:strand:- start:712 stop:846 length:135 start_codon:yes stop_codon:yes gene_type:complete
MTKEDLLALLRLCNADPAAIDAVEMAYELGYKAALEDKPKEEKV